MTKPVHKVFISFDSMIGKDIFMASHSLPLKSVRFTFILNLNNYNLQIERYRGLGMEETSVIIGTRHAWNDDHLGDQVCVKHW